MKYVKEYELLMAYIKENRKFGTAELRNIIKRYYHKTNTPYSDSKVYNLIQRFLNKGRGVGYIERVRSGLYRYVDIQTPVLENLNSRLQERIDEMKRDINSVGMLNVTSSEFEYLNNLMMQLREMELYVRANRLSK